MKTQTLRRGTSILAVLVLVMTTLVLPAFAAPAATAELTSGLTGFPSPDAPRSFSIRVDNSAESNLLGQGERITFVSITLPRGAAGVRLADGNGSPPPGWSVDRIDMGRLQVLEYRATSMVNPGIGPGGSGTFSFPALVDRPLNSERTGTFKVDVSNDGGDTLRSASATGVGLTTTVEILEILTGSDDGLRPTAPEGVTDRTATAGQTISYGYTVRNHAAEGISVDGLLAVANDPAGTTTIGDQTVTATVPGNLGTAPFEHTLVDLGPGETDRTVTFSADAWKTVDASEADAAQRTDNLTVWVPSTLDVTGISPIRTRATRTVEGTTITAFNTFTVDGQLTGTPDLTIHDGTLAFADTLAELDPEESSSSELTFGPTEVLGADGQHATTLTLTGEDENGFAYSQAIVRENPTNSQLIDADLLDIIIDTLAPDVVLEALLPDGQSAVKDGDRVSVTGTVTGADADIDTLEVFLDPDVGDNVAVTDLETRGSDVDGDGTTDTWQFTGSVSPSWHADAKSFVATANVLDTAGNAGTGSALSKVIDNIIPTLVDPGETGRTAAGESFIKITFEDTHAGDLRGGCDAGLYRIDGVPASVTEVRFAEDANTRCSGDDSNGTGTRYLILRNNLDPTATPQVNYLMTSPDHARGLGLVPTHDGAINDVVKTTIDTIRRIVPAPPEIISVTRNGGQETAVEDEERFFTRFGGDDLEVEFTIPGSGYTIQVVERSGGTVRVIHEQAVASPDETDLTGNGTDFVRVPLPALTGCDAQGQFCTEDGTYERGLRFVAGGPTGEIEWLGITLDTVPLGFTTAINGSQATVTFNDVVWAGTDAARDWFGYDSIVVDGQNERDYYRAQLVESPDTSTRTLTFAEDAVLDGVEYVRSNDSDPYVDRAGNEQPNTLN